MDYEVVGLLGRGGSAVVELALDGQGRRFALKRLVLTGSAAQIDVSRRRLRREAEILGRLAHPGILPIVEVIDDGSEVVLVLPAMAENLEDRVRRLGPLSSEEVTGIGRRLIEALAAAHRAGVVHRDVKPANVLFDPAGRPALADFGIAVTRDVTAGLTEAGTVLGTPMWMSPEQARGERPGPPSDVFSLAATLAYAATGEGPYQSGPALAVLRQAALGQVRPVTDAVPGVLRTPLAAMLDPLPERRPSAAGVIGGLDGTLVAPLLLPPEVRARRARRRRAAPPLIAAAPLASAAAPETAAPLPVAPPRAQFALPPPPPPTPRVPPLPPPSAAEVVPPGRKHRTRRLAAAGAITLAAGLAVAGFVVFDTAPTAHDAAPPAATVPTTEPSSTTTTCTPLPFEPCGTSAPAPHTNGRVCDPGWYNLDGEEADGCEAHSDYVSGMALTASQPLRANLVPASATDSFPAHVSGDALNLCWGSLHVTLTAPAHTAEQLTVWKGTNQVAQAVSTNGTPATATVDKPSCFGSDSEDLRVTVTAVATSAGASAKDFTLSRDRGW
jgi:eukaryotic-like serine/threonine-protein kinase